MAAHAKKFAARKAQERIADCMQVMGAAGYRRDARATPELRCSLERIEDVASRSEQGERQDADPGRALRPKRRSAAERRGPG